MKRKEKKIKISGKWLRTIKRTSIEKNEALIKLAALKLGRNFHTTMINSSDILSYSELQNAIENDLTDSNFKIAGELLLSAVTDYPTFNLKEPIDLITALRKVINDKLTFDNLERYLNSLSTHKDAWTIEALSTLLEMFALQRKNTYDKTIELDTIIQQLTQHYRK